MTLIDTAENSLALLVGTSKVESKDGFVKKTLVNHGVERRNNLVDRDRVITKAQNTVELAEGESQTRLRSSLSEDLILNFKVPDLKGVLRYKTAQATRAVADLEGGTVGLVSLRG